MIHETIDAVALVSWLEVGLSLRLLAEPVVAKITVSLSLYNVCLLLTLPLGLIERQDLGDLTTECTCGVCGKESRAESIMIKLDQEIQPD